MDSVNIDAFICTICRQLPLDSVETACGHIFCKACFKHHRETSLTRDNCPECGKGAKRASSKPSHQSRLDMAFREVYKADKTRTPGKMDCVETIDYLTSKIQSLTELRNSLYSSLRGNIEAQTLKFFGTSRKYNIIVCDPPWCYPNQHFNGGIKDKYSQMEDKDIFSLPVEGLCKKDCALLLWTTFPKLGIARDTMLAWGFRYTTCFLTWVKLCPGNGEIFRGSGCYTRPNSEICLLGIRGDFSKYRMRDQCISSVLIEQPDVNPFLFDVPSKNNSRLLGHHEKDELKFWEQELERNPLFTPRGEHSEKPDESYTKIEQIFGDLPRYDMFARKRRPGWDSFGDQLDKFPPEVSITPEEDRLWKIRQDRNSDFQVQFMDDFDVHWKDRTLQTADFTPNKSLKRAADVHAESQPLPKEPRS